MTRSGSLRAFRGASLSQMPKECRRRSSKDLGFSGLNDRTRSERRPAGKSSSSGDDERVAPPPVMHAPPVPQVTITPEGGGSPREVLPEDLSDHDGDRSLRRKPSNSSISSTGSSAVESEDDLLSDTESKSKGIITLEHLLDTGEVSCQ